MKISILSPDLSSNCLGRAHLLAKILQRRYEVEIAGPVFGDGIWPPIKDDNSISYKSIKFKNRLSAITKVKKLIYMIDGDVIYVSKPLFTSLFIALLIKLLTKKPTILDIDDWEMGMAIENIKKKFKFYKIIKYLNSFFCEKLIHFADDITVSNRFLQRKFGGKLIWHVRDTVVFNPAKIEKNAYRKKYNIDISQNIVMFLGTPRIYKGIEDLINATKLLLKNNVALVIVGIDSKNQYCQEIVAKGKKELSENNFYHYELQQFHKVPQFLAMADIIVIPQKKGSATIGQIPAKVFDAMAMAKPIIATNVSGLPEILDKCGWIVATDNPKQLADSIQYVIDNPQEGKRKGLKARNTCKSKYSWDAMEIILFNLFKKYEK